MILWVGILNASARRFYEKNGAKIVFELHRKSAYGWSGETFCYCWHMKDVFVLNKNHLFQVNNCYFNIVIMYEEVFIITLLDRKDNANPFAHATYVDPCRLFV